MKETNQKSVRGGRKRSAAGSKFYTTKIPEPLAMTIDEYVQSPEGQKLGYRSRADFVTKAARETLQRNCTPVQVPAEILAEIKRLVGRQKHGYRSVEEFVSDAIRRRLEQLKPLV